MQFNVQIQFQFHKTFKPTKYSNFASIWSTYMVRFIMEIIFEDLFTFIVFNVHMKKKNYQYEEYFINLGSVSLIRTTRFFKSSSVAHKLKLLSTQVLDKFTGQSYSLFAHLFVFCEFIPLGWIQQKMPIWFGPSIHFCPGPNKAKLNKLLQGIIYGKINFTFRTNVKLCVSKLSY